ARMSIVSAKEVYDFWFNEGNEEYWFEQNDAFDQEIEDRFYDTWEAGRQGLLYEWRETFEGRLAEIIVLDQFSRNLHRGSSLSYAQDQMALILSQEAMKEAEFSKQPLEKKNFILLPWMHSESKAVQEITEQLYLELDDAFNIKMMYQHKELIDQYGRYPHRNKAMGRTSTAEEIDFLENNDLAFT
ncbi:MAG: DUF924 domain-containing protein, partial [Atopostipes sp.]|nr:DUF924 domain-containing protein [Atopostipes sp.]